jgi:hypothetical protein
MRTPRSGKTRKGTTHAAFATTERPGRRKTSIIAQTTKAK